jgi:hypothetical protein
MILDDYDDDIYEVSENIYRYINMFDIDIKHKMPVLKLLTSRNFKFYVHNKDKNSEIYDAINNNNIQYFTSQL